MSSYTRYFLLNNCNVLGTSVRLFHIEFIHTYSVQSREAEILTPLNRKENPSLRVFINTPLKFQSRDTAVLKVRSCSPSNSTDFPEGQTSLIGSPTELSITLQF